MWVHLLVFLWIKKTVTTHQNFETILLLNEDQTTIQISDLISVSRGKINMFL